MFIVDRDVNEGTSVYSQFSSVDVVIGSQAINLSSASALTFLAWDILITLDDEVRLMWPHALSSMKFIYFITRYLSFLGQIPLLFVGSELSPYFRFTPRQCFMWQIYQGILTSLVIISVDVILIVRVCAMYHGHPIIPRIIIFLFLVEITGMGVSLGLALPGIVLDDMCDVLHVPFTLGLYGLGVIVFQTALFALTLYKFVKDVKYYDGWHSIPLMVLLLRDGTWAFILLFCVYIGQVGLNLLRTPGAVGLLFPWMLTLCSFCGYRIILNLRWFSVDSTEERIANILGQDIIIQEQEENEALGNANNYIK